MGSADIAGDIGPFQLAIFLTVVVFVMVLFFWPENRGDIEDETETEGGKKRSGLWNFFFGGFGPAARAIQSSRAVLYLGLSQACFEGGVYTFVFLWVPALQRASGQRTLPTGLIFSCFMLAMTFGGAMSRPLLSRVPGGPGMVCLLVYVGAAISMFIPLIWGGFWPVLGGFLCLEACQGVFQASGGALRSRHFPDALQSSLLSVFRIPLNLLVVVGTRITANADADADASAGNPLWPAFLAAGCMHLCALFCQSRLLALESGGSGGGKKQQRRRSSLAKRPTAAEASASGSGSLSSTRDPSSSPASQKKKQQQARRRAKQATSTTAATSARGITPPGRSATAK